MKNEEENKIDEDWMEQFLYTELEVEDDKFTGVTIDNVREITGTEKIKAEENNGSSWNTGVSMNCSTELDSYRKFVLYDKEQRKVYLECIKTSSRESNIRVLRDDEFIEGV